MGLVNATKHAIAADVVAGCKNEFLANKYSTSLRTISRIRTEMNRAPVKPEVLKDWRDTGNEKAIVASFAGLDCEDDPYKRATLGMSWLSKTGQLLPDNYTQVNNLFASMPADWADEFAPVVIEADATVQDTEQASDTTTSSDAPTP